MPQLNHGNISLLKFSVVLESIALNYPIGSSDPTSKKLKMKSNLLTYINWLDNSISIYKQQITRKYKF